ncbi:MAG: phosphoribosylamine--glycine ligase [Cryobacterium sp.]
MRILVLGSGAREHAIITALLRDEAPHVITAAPGNAGIAQQVRVAVLDANDPVAVTAYAIEHAMDLVVIGPEAPLVAGVADALRTRGIAVFGPGKAAAALEGSKTFAKRIMHEAGVPTGRAVRAGTLAEAEAALDEFGAPYVVKADGLAAGKGVLVTPHRDAALAHSRYWLEHGSVLIEEFLDGQEISLFLLSDGHTVLPLSPAQDYKRLGDNDVGPNTGGMGAYSPLPWLETEFGSEQAFITEIIDTVANPTIAQLAREGTPFIGLLYCGLILTRDGIRVIEFNARFGDPETQVVLPRLVTPLAGLLYAASTGGLGELPWPHFSADAAVTVVLASENYPETPLIGRAITGLADAAAVPGVTVAHAATALVAGELVSTGGRVLSVVAVGTDFTQARSRAYAALGSIGLAGGQWRTDIAARVADPAAVQLPGWAHAYSGKVRDLYVPRTAVTDATAPGAAGLATADRVLVVASDRVSAFDHVLEPGIPGKGELLTTLSLWWFDRLCPVANHLIADHELVGATVRELIPAAVAGRAMLCTTLDMFPVECVVRGYLTGSGWKEYQASQTVCGIALPAGLHDGDRLPEPLYTPAWKAPMGEHDENISFERTVELVGADAAAKLRDLSLEIFRRASAIAENAGLILADTKFEFGTHQRTGVITLADEVLTSDSSRYWDAERWATGTTPAERMQSFDKQIVRDWLAAHWNQEGVPPVLPAHIVEQTAARYRELLERLTGA